MAMTTTSHPAEPSEHMNHKTVLVAVTDIFFYTKVRDALRLNAFQALETLRSDPKLKHLPVLAFANHEEVDTWNRAKSMGVTKIVSRNEFSARTKGLIEEIIANAAAHRH
jgi:CheY-like chemotaxis protein